MKLSELAKIVAGKVVGDDRAEIKSVSQIDEAKSGDLVFVLDDRFLASALSSPATAIVASSNNPVKGKPAILVKDPRMAMAKLLPLFAPKLAPFKGIHKTAIVPKSCRLGKDVAVGAYVVLGENVEIGDNSTIYPHVWIGDNSIIGKSVLLHSGCRIGVDGFGFVQEGGKHRKIPQIGNVIIGDDVELFANVCVSRATLGSTVIGSGTKVDNLTHIAHNCRIGKDCAIVSLVGFAGSVTLEDRVSVAGQAGFKGHITIGENSVVMARAGVTKDVPQNSVVSGFPAQDHRKEIAYQVALRRLAKK
ncbi:MAG: UDP-3-O-(3-hydroxymyristoyl)glucosamine N-acyltransferase [Candidatus Saganbacteria bacterium]|nr:UDP-3-O-(3-hydroxymyristoyl)glucosamine N-acyltransferase [Candidatus Saganbacteria bacterium]